MHCHLVAAWGLRLGSESPVEQVPCGPEDLALQEAPLRTGPGGVARTLCDQVPARAEIVLMHTRLAWEPGTEKQPSHRAGQRSPSLLAMAESIGQCPAALQPLPLPLRRWGHRGAPAIWAHRAGARNGRVRSLGDYRRNIGEKNE